MNLRKNKDNLVHLPAKGWLLAFYTKSFCLLKTPVSYPRWTVRMCFWIPAAVLSTFPQFFHRHLNITFIEFWNLWVKQHILLSCKEGRWKKATQNKHRVTKHCFICMLNHWRSRASNPEFVILQLALLTVQSHWTQQILVESHWNSLCQKLTSLCSLAWHEAPTTLAWTSENSI